MIKMENFSTTMEGRQWLENSRLFKTVVVAQNGRCAEVTTLHPLEFSVYKYWLSKAPDREPIKRRRDEEQSRLVGRLIREYMLDIDVDEELSDMKHFPKEVVEEYRRDFMATL